MSGLNQLQLVNGRDVKKLKLQKGRFRRFGVLSKKNKKTIRGDFCHPEQQGKFSCFPEPALHRIAKAWNRKNKNNLIKLDKNVNRLWKNINKKFRDKCSNERCWSTIEEVKNDSNMRGDNLKKYFRPLFRKSWIDKPYEWLSTPDIEQVMKQYEVKYPDFVFIGPVPMDFDSKDSVGQCIVNELCQLDLQEMFNKGKYRIGIIFNLDYHDQPGSHWVSLYVSMLPDDPNFGVHFFDSYASPPPPEVNELANRLVQQSRGINFSKVSGKDATGGTKKNRHNNNQLQRENDDFKYTYNKVRHQYKNSECGVYCLNFLEESLDRKERRSIPISDETIHQKRLHFYHPQTGGGNTPPSVRKSLRKVGGSRMEHKSKKNKTRQLNTKMKKQQQTKRRQTKKN